ncbi:receptor-type tyrosine-protein phosphatase H-like isoform X2 [Synchiropus splendidus]|uniref:receptor-type tyrosine-protein phosphatase H-like isoform X2 n=1 Tax=Synchiropus splendidus TaxID=270530 RepID=UPI00237D4D64|nr:receptor-type tyrosine-protein phosphatase H-like isoform X2 [Synchiropus splendidus]
MKPVAGQNRWDQVLQLVFLGLLWFQQIGATTTVATQPTTAPSTTPPDVVADVTVLTQTNTTITLSWDKVDNTSSYLLKYSQNGSSVENSITAPEDKTSVTHVVSPLTPATEYNFKLFTSSGGLLGSGYQFNASTAPPDVQEFVSVGQNESSISLRWEEVDGVSGYMLQFDGREEHFPANTVTGLITGLTSATIYEFSLFTIYKNITSRGVNLTAATAPTNVEEVHVLAQSETSITLGWSKVNNVSTYILQYADHTRPVSSENQSQSFQVTRLSAGTTYEFTLHSVFQNISSTGFVFKASTVPSQAAQVAVTSRSETTLTVTWQDLNEDWKYSLLIDGRTFESFNKSAGLASMLVSELMPGALYNFSLTTIFANLNSSPYEGYSLTTIDCAGVDWKVTPTTIQGRVNGLFSKATVTNGTNPHVVQGGQNVAFTGLYPGATYNLSLVYERGSVQLPQCHHSLQTYPPFVKASCKYSDAGYSITVFWGQPVGRWDAVDINVAGNSRSFPKKDPAQYSIAGFQPAKTYQVSVTILSGSLGNPNPVFDCHTDPRGVIAGSVVAVVIFAVAVGLIVYVFLKKASVSKGSSKDRIKNVRVSAADFPGHHGQLSMDENRGFSEQYEDLFGVGAEQSQHVALYPENQVKNRFTNILPYDASRVKLSGKSDYINASFMPGYRNDQEYIATQGPLPATVSDFWRMVWEQQVRSIVMVTNCVELTRIKCEQYWPPPDRPHLYGDLLVSVDSQTEETNWTLKDITVKHSSTSEQRRVKHFHFTAWPDHGVPQTTSVLIKFRRLVRQHIQEEMSTAPTVVHCSAGVGRTGTLIALDVLLQQLEQEKAVDIHGFVHKMRLRRPHMVQTEAQYVYLHQCILDSLPSHEQQENIYENSDMIYVNATALKEFR